MRRSWLAAALALGLLGLPAPALAHAKPSGWLQYGAVVKEVRSCHGEEDCTVDGIRHPDGTRLILALSSLRDRPKGSVSRWADPWNRWPDARPGDVAIIETWDCQVIKADVIGHDWDPDAVDRALRCASTTGGCKYEWDFGLRGMDDQQVKGVLDSGHSDD